MLLLAPHSRTLSSPVLISCISSTSVDAADIICYKMRFFFLLLSTIAMSLMSFTTVRSFAMTSRITRKHNTMHNFQAVRLSQGSALHMCAVDADVDGASSNEDVASDEILEVLDTEIVIEEEIMVEEPKEVEKDPYEEALKALEAQLRSETISLETTLKSERNSLSKIKDKASESGKNGYFIVQAKVAEFQKNKAVEQKLRVSKNKKEFVLKMLPVVDAFRAAPSIAPPTTEREENMHKNFGSLLASIMVVFEKYGYKEYDAAIGETLIPARHQVSEVIDGVVDGLVSSQLKRGIEDKDGEVLRRALVIATKVPKPETPEPAPEVVEAVAEEVAEEK